MRIPDRQPARSCKQGALVGALTKHVVNVTIGQLLFVYDFHWVQFLPSLKLQRGSVDSTKHGLHPQINDWQMGGGEGRGSPFLHLLQSLCIYPELHLNPEGRCCRQATFRRRQSRRWKCRVHRRPGELLNKIFYHTRERREGAKNGENRPLT